MLALAGLLILASGASDATAQTPSGLEVDAKAGSSEGASTDDKPVCRTESPKAASRLGRKRVCRTAAEWAKLEQEDRAAGRIPAFRAVPGPSRPGIGGAGGNE